MHERFFDILFCFFEHFNKELNKIMCNLVNLIKTIKISDKKWSFLKL